VTGDLVARRDALPQWVSETSALAALSCSVVTPMLARDEFQIPDGCKARLVAFPASALDREDAFAEILADRGASSIIYARSDLPPWARIVTENNGRVHLATDERLAVLGGDEHLVSLLTTFGRRVAFVLMPFGQIEAVAELINGNPDLAGLFVSDLDESPEGLAALDVLQRLVHVDWLALRFEPYWESRHSVSTLTRVASIKALRHLVLGHTNAFDLRPLDALTQLRSLMLWTDDSSEWTPTLPELRTLSVAVNPGSTTLASPHGCPKLEGFYIERGGNIDGFLQSVEQLPRLRRLGLRIWAGPRAQCRSDMTDLLARLVQLRTLTIVGRPYLDVSGGRLRHLETLTALERLNLSVIGATLDDVDALAERLPSTKLKIGRYERFEHMSGYFYDIDRLLSQIESSVAERSSAIGWRAD
jgi:hypothetical protein